MLSAQGNEFVRCGHIKDTKCTLEVRIKVQESSPKLPVLVRAKAIETKISAARMTNVVGLPVTFCSLTSQRKGSKTLSKCPDDILCSAKPLGKFRTAEPHPFSCC